MEGRKATMLRVRITNGLDHALRAEAARLRVRPSQLARLALACGLRLIELPGTAATSALPADPPAPTIAEECGER